MTDSTAPYQGLDVYKNASSAYQLVQTIIPKLPSGGDEVTATRLKRFTKVIPHFIAKGNLGAAMAMTGEIVTTLENIQKITFKDYHDKKLCLQLIDQYDKVRRQLFKLNHVRKNKKPTEQPPKKVRASKAAPRVIA